MIGPEHIDHVVEPTQVLVAVVSDVGREIGVGAVGLDQRAIGIVAVILGAEEGLLAIFPILGRLALGRLEPALVDHAAIPQPLQRQVDITALPVQCLLGEEHVVLDAELSKVGLDEAQALPPAPVP